MMRTPSVLILLLLSFILSCSTPTQYSGNGVGGTGNIARGGDDESGIGGTGNPIPNGVGGTGKQLASGGGLGGTGQIAKASGLGGTGIIGEVTGFGSIFVNGIEVEFNNQSEIQSDNTVNNNVQPEIGNIVEILAHRVGDETFAKKMNIRHEVVGPVSAVNIKQRRFSIIGQIIKLNNPKLRLPKVGQMIAVSGMRDHRGIIFASHINQTNSKSIWLIDQIARSRANTLKLGRSTVYTDQASNYSVGDIIRVRASYQNGKLVADEIYSNKAFGNQVQHMVLQGFIRRGNRNNYQIGNIQFSTRSARTRQILKKNRGRWTRVEVSRNQIGLWEVEQFIGNRTLIRGSARPNSAAIDAQRLYQQDINTRSTARQRFNKSKDAPQISYPSGTSGTTTPSPSTMMPNMPIPDSGDSNDEQNSSPFQMRPFGRN
ncbi:hypothetical protein MNBD_GAMMA22-338 [hydrothermal vent metagenome]|uniref:DUF5666 domain-containing protein n=1 Tax=hydrothermal vent metagenome TaxID=652676 RepID=A0A3B0ZYF4_9ZZZZ